MTHSTNLILKNMKRNVEFEDLNVTIWFGSYGEVFVNVVEMGIYNERTLLEWMKAPEFKGILRELSLDADKENPDIKDMFIKVIQEDSLEGIWMVAELALAYALWLSPHLYLRLYSVINSGLSEMNKHHLEHDLFNIIPYTENRIKSEFDFYWRDYLEEKNLKEKKKFESAAL